MLGKKKPKVKLSTVDGVAIATKTKDPTGTSDEAALEIASPDTDPVRVTVPTDPQASESLISISVNPDIAESSVEKKIQSNFDSIQEKQASREPSQELFADQKDSSITNLIAHPKKRKQIKRRAQGFSLKRPLVALATVLILGAVSYGVYNLYNNLLDSSNTTTSAPPTAPEDSDASISTTVQNSATVVDTPDPEPDPSPSEPDEEVVDIFSQPDDTPDTPLPQDEEPVEEMVDPGDFHVEILNGNGVAGAAGAMEALVEPAGFTIDYVGNADAYTYTQTVVRYKPSAQAAVDDLLPLIESSYTIQLEDVLSADNTIDIQIIVGKE